MKRTMLKKEVRIIEVKESRLCLVRGSWLIWALLILLSKLPGITAIPSLLPKLDNDPILKDGASILNSLAEKQLNLCHQVLIRTSQEPEDIAQILQMFVSSLTSPILSYEWSAMSQSPPQTIFRRTLPLETASHSSQNAINDYCIVYFLIVPKFMIQSAIKEIPEYNWFPGSTRYLIFLLKEPVSPEEMKNLSKGGGHIAHIIFVSRININHEAPSISHQNKRATFAISRVCHYCYNADDGVILLGEWIPGFGLKVISPVMAKMTTDFKGHEFKGVTLKFPPYITYHKGPNQELIPEDSLDIRIMTTIAEVYNFTFKLVEPIDQQWGYQLENGSFTGVLGTVSRREADFSMNLLITAERESASDFTYGYLDDPLTFAIASPKPLPQWLALIRPYSGMVWTYFLLALLLAGPIYWLALRVVPGKQIRSLAYSWLQIFGSMISQSGIWDSSSGIRLLVGFWMLFSLVVSKSYVGNLVAHLMVPTLSPVINSLEELVKSEFKWGIADYGASNYQLFKTSKVPLYNTIFRGMELCPSNKACLEKAAKEQYAFISWRNNMRESIEENFKDRNGKSLIYLAREDFFPSDIGFALQQGSSLKDNFDVVILHLVEAGLVQKWLTDIIKKGATKSSPMETEQTDSSTIIEETSEVSKRLAFYHLQGIFIVYGVGVVLSFAVFLLEFLVGKMFLVC